MVTKAISQSDLNSLELKIKKDNIEERHNLDNKLWTYFFKVDEMVTKQAVNDNILETMTASITKLEKVVTDWFEKVNSKIDWFQDKFATKEDHKENVSKISAVEKALENINIRIAGVSGWFAVIIFLIEKYSK